MSLPSFVDCCFCKSCRKDKAVFGFSKGIWCKQLEGYVWFMDFKSKTYRNRSAKLPVEKCPKYKKEKQ